MNSELSPATVAVWGGEDDYLMAGATQSLDTELYRFPMVLEPSSLALSLVTVVVSTVISAMIVRRKLNHLDLIGVLKTRE